MIFKNLKPPYMLKPLITSGLTNELYLLNNQYFLKKSKAIDQPFLNFSNQVAVIKLIQWKKFTLPIIETKIEKGQLLTLMPYYHDLITLTEQPIYEELLMQLANLVKQLHQFSIDDNLNIITWNPIKQLNLYCSLIDIPTSLVKIKNDLSTWLNHYQPQTLVLCHNDLTLNNFVKNHHHWYLIDWDFATWNDPLFDIASFASESLTNENDLETWFKCFTLNQAEIAIVKQWMLYQDFIWYHWAQYLYQQTKQKIYQTISEMKWQSLAQYH